MKSFIASLRNLVLPFGTTHGTRIILNGVTGAIQFYDATNTLVIDEESSSSSIRVGANQSIVLDGKNNAILVYSGVPAAGNLVVAISPSNGTDSFGNSWSGQSVSVFGPNGTLLLYYSSAANEFPSNLVTANNGGVAGTTLQRELLITSPGTNTDTRAVLTLSSSSDDNNTPTQATIDSDPIITSIGLDSQAGNSAAVTTVETTVQTVQVSVKKGAVYRIKSYGHWTQSVAGDIFILRLRDNAGNQIEGTRIDTPPTAGQSYPRMIEGFYLATADDGAFNFTLTAIRNAGTGNITRNSANLYVERWS